MKNTKNHITPPRQAQRLLSWFLKEELAEEVLGDLDEKFYSNLNNNSKAKARRNYWYQVFNYLRPFAFKFLKFKHSNNTIMFKHNLIISFRQMLKNKAYSSINIGGLALGMTVAMLIGLWVNDELTYNKYHNNYDNIVQVLKTESWNDNIYTNSALTTGMGTLLAQKFPNHFEKVVMVSAGIENRIVAFGNKKFTQNGYFIQKDGPDMLGLKMKYGSHSGLAEINSIMLSESVATKLFGDKNPVNEVIKMNAVWDLKVTGVYEDLPQNSEFREATYFSSLDRYLKNRASLDVWNNYNMYVFGLLNPESNIDEVSSLVAAAYLERLAEIDDAEHSTFFLNPMRDWHLNSEFIGGIRVTSKAKLFVWFYAVIGGFVLVLACINFMNLSTARSEKRAKEVGIRKTLGSLRRQLIGQFYMESILYCILAFVLSLLLLKASLSWFNEISGKTMIEPWGESNFWFLAIGFMLITSILAGSYPAAYLSAFKPG